MNHILAGYLLVEPYAYTAWSAKQAGPKNLITASDCLCEIHPGKWGLSWASRLEKDYEEKLQLKFNAMGFFDDLESANFAVEYTRRDEVGAEPGFWAPFKMVKEQA